MYRDPIWPFVLVILDVLGFAVLLAYLVILGMVM